ncbi:MAG: low molecular weight protein-tyrosine-phosphatase [Pseudomonadota bacterium]
MTTSSQAPIKVLMVCLGNICRSPTAEAVLRAQVQAAGLGALIEVDSAGTSDWHIGEAPDSRSIQAATTRLYDLSTQRSRQVKTLDFEEFDYILAMDRQNLSDLQDNCPVADQQKIELLLNYGNTGWTDVPDPFNAGKDGFELVLDLVEVACNAFLAHLITKHNLPNQQHPHV